MPPLFEKLQKLIAHERSARAVGSTQEAEAFAERIATLLTEHKLSMTEVEFEAQDTDNPIGDSRLEGLPATIEQWRIILSNGVAASFYCRVLASPQQETRSSTFIWVGRESDRAAAIEMFKYLSALGHSFAKLRVDAMQSRESVRKLLNAVADDKKAKASVLRVLRNTFSTWTKDFLAGYAASLHKRLTENRKKLEANATGTGLILRDQAALESYVHEQFEVEPGKKCRGKTTFAGAFNEGWQKGAEVSIKAKTGLGASA